MSTFKPVNATELTDSNHTYLIYANPGMGKTYALGFLPGKTLVIDVDGSSSTIDLIVRNDLEKAPVLAETNAPII